MHEEVPDVIYDEGEVGKEPMIRVLGRNALEVVDKVLRAVDVAREIAHSMKRGGDT